MPKNENEDTQICQSRQQIEEKQGDKKIITKTAKIIRTRHGTYPVTVVILTTSEQ